MLKTMTLASLILFAVGQAALPARAHGEEVTFKTEPVVEKSSWFSPAKVIVASGLVAAYAGAYQKSPLVQKMTAQALEWSGYLLHGALTLLQMGCAKLKQKIS